MGSFKCIFSAINFRNFKLLKLIYNHFHLTERVIAMSFPSKGMMALYRNPVAVSDVLVVYLNPSIVL